MVRLIKHDDRANITLAIGDGANDVSMIMEAHIGIGIHGKEGVRAAQAADFSIHKFKYLWNLVMYHGRYNYLRIAELILYFFYKNIIFTIPQLFFVFMSDFSAQTVFEDWYISFYNLFFTALPVLLKGIFETDIDFKRYDKEQHGDIKALYPSLYYLGQRSVIFNIKNYLVWVGTGVGQAFIFFMVAFYTFQYSIISEDGYNESLWGTSITIFTAIIITVNLKIMVSGNF